MSSETPIVTVQEQTIEDKGVSGLTLIIKRLTLGGLIRILGEFPYGNREFFFDVNGAFDGTGTCVCPDCSNGTIA